MKVKDVAKAEGVDEDDFVTWLKRSRYNISPGLRGWTFDVPVDARSAVEEFRREAATLLERRKARQAEAEAAEVAERAAREEAEVTRDAAIAQMLVTTGFEFQGRTIVRYGGYISGDCAVQIDRGKDSFLGNPTNVGAAMMSSLKEIREQAMQDLLHAAYAVGCNAVIGIDFDYLHLDPQTANSSGGTTYFPYVFGVTANGTAVELAVGPAG